MRIRLMSLATFGMLLLLFSGADEAAGRIRPLPKPVPWKAPIQKPPPPIPHWQVPQQPVRPHNIPPAQAWAAAKGMARPTPQIRLAWSAGYMPTDALAQLARGSKKIGLTPLEHHQLVHSSLGRIAFVAEHAREPWALLHKLT